MQVVRLVPVLHSNSHVCFVELHLISVFCIECHSHARNCSKEGGYSDEVLQVSHQPCFIHYSAFICLLSLFLLCTRTSGMVSAGIFLYMDTTSTFKILTPLNVKNQKCQYF